MNEEELEKFKVERNKALIDFDLEYFRRQYAGIDEDILILSIHKARYQCTTLPAEVRHASAAFLREGNHKIFGQDILPEGELPK